MNETTKGNLSPVLSLKLGILEWRHAVRKDNGAIGCYSEGCNIGKTRHNARISNTIRLLGPRTTG
eukprot:4164673-Prorocentrum_lima.AAC.1